MYPVLFNIGPFPISSFGLFLALSLGFGTFMVWRLAQVYDLDREKVIDLILLSFVIGLLGSRIFFVLFNFNEFNSLERIIFINKYPGFSFWGGLLSGVAALFIFARRFKFNFWLIADFGMVGLFAGLIIASFGCIFSGCLYGLPSNLSFAIPIVGVIEDRFPLQVIFGLFYLLFFLILWKKALRFHFQGAIFSLGLIYLGLINLSLIFFRGDPQRIFLGFKVGVYFSLTAILLGIRLYYFLGKRSFRKDLFNFKAFFVNPVARERYLLKLKRSWYNATVRFKTFFTRSFKKAGRKLNVKTNPREF